MPKCPGCSLTHLPVCYHELHPDFDPKHPDLATRSIFESSVRHDWPHRRALPDDVRERLAFPPGTYRPWNPAGPIRLGLASPGLQIGGADRWMLDLIQATNSPPFSWQGIAVSSKGFLWPAMVAEAEKLVPVTYGQAAIADLASRVDVLVVWGVRDVHAMLAGAGCRTVAVSQNSGIDPFTVDSLRDATAATACVGVSKASIEAFPVSVRARAKVIYNTAQEPRPTLSRDEQRAAWGVPSGRRALGFLGRVTEQKYPEAIPRALEHLPPEWVGVVVGPLEQEAPIRRAIAQCEVGNRIILAGPTDDPASALAAFDVMLAPSIFEGLPVAWVEAWLLGVPLIATAVAFTEEHPELIRSVPQSATGQELAAAILTDQADAAGTAARVELARTFAREQLGFDRFKAEWSHLLASTVGPEAVTALEGAQRRAAKPRVPLGTPCIPCRQSKGQS